MSIYPETCGYNANDKANTQSINQSIYFNGRLEANDTNMISSISIRKEKETIALSPVHLSVCLSHIMRYINLLTY